MKQHLYEKKEGVMIAFFFLILLEIIGCIFLFKIQEYNYEKITGFYTNTNRITVIVSKEERKWLQDNRPIYIDNKKKKYEISEDKGILLKENKKNYYELVLKIKLSKRRRTEQVTLTIQKNKKRLWEIIKDSWEGD